jgi:hypothetical protein
MKSLQLKLLQFPAASSNRKFKIAFSLIGVIALVQNFAVQLNMARQQSELN